MLAIKREREEAPLPEVASPALPEADQTGVSSMSLPVRPCQAVGRLRDRHEMDVIGHQAVRPDLHLVQAAPLCHEVKVGSVVVGPEEDLLPSFAPLRNVVRAPYRHPPSRSYRAVLLVLPTIKCQESSIVFLEFRF